MRHLILGKIVIVVLFINMSVYATNATINEVISSINEKYYITLSDKQLEDIRKISLSDTHSGIKIKEIISKLDKYSHYYTKEDCETLMDDDSKLDEEDIISFYSNCGLYIKINTFTLGTDDKFRNIINSINNIPFRRMKSIYLDLSDCSGGMISVMENIANLIVPKGRIYSGLFKGNIITKYSGFEGLRYNIVTFVSKKTASSAEILVSALKDAKATKVIGERTFGKTSIQELIPLQDGGILKLTVGKYLTRNGSDIDGVGIEPDIYIENELINSMFTNSFLQFKKNRMLSGWDKLNGLAIYTPNINGGLRLND